ncbi:phage head-tail connector protein [Clostridium botulinum]|uniref:phage head-tail connector protein n=1 Tax=Clostridium botulinum TaxID=1491 RepID=UPI0007738A55|nr:phage head-tail connector protein [Clostridium botulinum]
MIEKIIESIKLRPGISSVEEFLLADLVQDSVIEVSDYINLKEGKELPMGCISIIKDIVVIKVNKLGSEGVSSESYSGVSQSYTEDIPKDILRKLKR